MVYDYRYYRFYLDNKNSITISFSFHHFFRRGENKTEFRHAAPLRDVSFEASLNFLFNLAAVKPWFTTAFFGSISRRTIHVCGGS